jgi:hypothetical protein
MRDCEEAVIAVIRALGFVGNMHYCPGCMRRFHDDCGQHEPGCTILAGILADEGWLTERLWPASRGPDGAE